VKITKPYDEAKRLLNLAELSKRRKSRVKLLHQARSRIAFLLKRCYGKEVRYEK
jgi:hypothetical protein